LEPVSQNPKAVEVVPRSSKRPVNLPPVKCVCACWICAGAKRGDARGCTGGSGVRVRTHVDVKDRVEIVEALCCRWRVHEKKGGGGEGRCGRVSVGVWCGAVLAVGLSGRTGRRRGCRGRRREFGLQHKQGIDYDRCKSGRREPSPRAGCARSWPDLLAAREEGARGVQVAAMPSVPSLGGTVSSRRKVCD